MSTTFERDKSDIIKLVNAMEYLRSDDFIRDQWKRYKNSRVSEANFQAKHDSMIANGRNERERVRSGYYKSRDAEVAQIGALLAQVKRLYDHEYQKAYGRFLIEVLEKHELESARQRRKAAEDKERDDQRQREFHRKQEEEYRRQRNSGYSYVNSAEIRDDEEYLRDIHSDLPFSEIRRNDESQWTQIKKLYRKGSAIRHPDKNLGNEERATEEFKRWQERFSRFKARHYPDLAARAF